MTARRIFFPFLAAMLWLAAMTVAHAQEAVDQEVVLVPNRVIYPGEPIDLAALKEVTLKKGRQSPAGMLTRAEQLDGKVARRTLLPGRYVTTNAVRNAWLVEQGAAVEAVYAAGGLRISASAVTLQPGAAGDVVKIRNVDSGKVLTGTVMADGSVLVSSS